MGKPFIERACLAHKTGVPGFEVMAKRLDFPPALLLFILGHIRGVIEPGDALTFAADPFDLFIGKA